MRRNQHITALAVTLLTGALLAGCASLGAEPKQVAANAPKPATSYGPQVVHFDGLRNIRFGHKVTDLTAQGFVNVSNQGCGPRFTDIPQASPVFADGVLVMMWFNPPLATPEGVMVGTPVSEVRKRYSTEVDLTPPAGSYTFPGLLVRNGDRAYLFLHDGKTVQKEIAGYADYVRRLYTDGFGAC